MILAKLFILGQERELLWCETNYHRNTRTNGKPSSETMGGLLTLCFPSQAEDHLILRWMTKDSEDDTWSEVDKMEKGQICFYDNGFDYPPTKIWKFNDAHLISYEETFSATGEDPMSTTITISPAIQNYGVEYVKRWNVSHIAPAPSEQVSYEALENEEEFYLDIRHISNKKTLVPLGIPSFNGTPENEYFEFEFEITGNDIDDFQVEFLNNGKVIQTYFSSRQTLNEVVVTAKGSVTPQSSTTTSNQNTSSNYPKGKYLIKWDGFDSNGIFSSTIFTTGKLKGRIKGRRNGKEKTAETSEFSFEYKEVNWVDVKIDKNTKRIDVTLRVNLKDGGARGVECSEQIVAPDPIIIRECAWDRIPKEDLITSKPSLKSRTKSFKDLEKLALEGLNYHWGRNRNHYVAKNVTVDGQEYEVFVNTINTTENAMDDVNLTFNTNNKWMRSGNPGTVEDPISLIGNIVSREAICYNVGYIKYSYGWDFQAYNKEDISFKETSAHEIGHTILKAYGGTFYSYGHKGTVNTITQSENDTATNYPINGEIDLMPYYKNWIPYSQRNRMVASEEDVLSLIWLTKITIK